MAKITGVGGVFFKSKGDSAALAAWYRKHLGMSLEDFGGAILKWPDDKAEDQGLTVWHVAEKDSKWFSPSKSSFMINYRVDNLGELLDQLRAGGVEVIQGQFGKLDVFVSNARPEIPAFFQPPLEITLEQWDTAFNSQAKAFLVGVREAARLMRNGGRVLAITYAQGSRTGGLQPWVGMGSAKAALESLVRYFAVALAKRGITVNAIRPGWSEDIVLNTMQEHD